MTVRTRLLAHLLAASALAVAAVATTAVAPAGIMPTASAACASQGDSFPIFYYLDGTLRAEEHAQSGTCNGDGTYRGTIADKREDGRCALAKFMDGGGVISTQGIDCWANNGPVDYVFNDRNGDHHAWIKVCIETRCDNIPWIEIRGY